MPGFDAMPEGASRTGAAPVPAPTWIDEIQVPPIIETFLSKTYSRPHYRALADQVSGILDKKLKEKGVQFKLSARAKDKQSLREKLIMRHREDGKAYNNEDDIKKDIVDLAGVRIILYMPTKEDLEKVEQVIKGEWGLGVKPKSHPPPRVIKVDPDEVKEKQTAREEDLRRCQGSSQGCNDQKMAKRMRELQQAPFIFEEKDEEENIRRRNLKYRPRHLGYRAIHYRIPMSNDDNEWLLDDQVEVQVVSALTHAWAEAGHDILYKSYAFGPPELEESRTLDALNGLIQSGDLLLEQFQEMVTRRTSRPFRDRAELKMFLHSFWDRAEDENDGAEDLEVAKFPRGEGIYILFKFLEAKKLNSPMEVRRPLKELKYPYEHHGKESLISRSFAPPAQLHPEMSVVICLIRHLLCKEPYKADMSNRTPREMCIIMMSALTILDYALGGCDKARDHLQQTINMTDVEFKSLNWVLGDEKRYPLLAGSINEQVVEDDLRPVWAWFRREAGTATSLCGFLFRLAEMGCRKHLDAMVQMKQLSIDPLSRRSTSTLAS